MFAVNSYEMLQRNELIVPYFDGQMNMWNSKPPLLMWTQMLSIKLLGFNEFAVRLPSAIAVSLTMLFVFYYIKKSIDITFAWITFLILLTAQGFHTFHTGRTGDSDAILTLLLTISNLLFVDSITRDKFSNKRIIMFFVILSFAFLCKSFASMLFGLGYIIVYWIYKNNNKTSLFLKSGFWTGAIVFALTSIGFMFLRNHLQPGYINFVFSVDIGRMATEIEAHKEPFLYYIENLSIYNFSFWFFISLLGILIVSFKKENNKFFISVIILLISYLLVISLSVSKLPWYSMPIYPLLAILAGIPIYETIKWMKLSKVNLSIILILLFAFPYNYLFGLSQSNSYTPYEQINEASEQYLNKEINSNTFIDSTYILHTGPISAMKFYEYKLRDLDKRMFITDKVDFPSNAIVTVSRDSLKSKLLLNYKCKLIDSALNVYKYKVLSAN